MKPQNKNQAYIFDYAQTNFTREQGEQIKAWAFETACEHIGYRTTKRTNCMSCGERYVHAPESAKKKKDVCPACKRTLTIEWSLKRSVDQRWHVAKLEVVEGWQVVRFWEITTRQRAGEKPSIYIKEVVQQWLNPAGKNEVIARNRGGMNSWNDHFHGYLEIRDRRTLFNKYDCWPKALYPNPQILPIYARNGFRGDFGDCTPFYLFREILTDPKAETLLKAKQMGLLYVLAGSNKSYQLRAHWNSVKIALRNKFKPKSYKEAVLWLDYLDLLRTYGKDLRNAHYVCPKNVKAEHDRYVAMKQADDRRREEERRAQDAEKRRIEEERRAHLANTYAERMARFFDLCFTHKSGIVVQVLRSVQEFEKEGDVLNHCVYTNSYYTKENSLILSARIDGKPLETIEVDLSRFKVVQCYGYSNTPSNYHNAILKLMQRNMGKIKKAHEVKTAQLSVAA